MNAKLTDIVNGKGSKIFDQVRVGNETVTVTRHGIPIATITPIQPKKTRAELVALYDQYKMDDETALEVMKNFREYERKSDL